MRDKDLQGVVVRPLVETLEIFQDMHVKASEYLENVAFGPFQLNEKILRTLIALPHSTLTSRRPVSKTVFIIIKA